MSCQIAREVSQPPARRNGSRRNAGPVPWQMPSWRNCRSSRGRPSSSAHRRSPGRGWPRKTVTGKITKSSAGRRSISRLRWPVQCGAARSSVSRKTSRSDRACSTASFRQVPAPFGSPRRRKTRIRASSRPACSSSSQERSVEPSSTITASQAGSSWVRREANVAGRKPSRLKLGQIKLSFGFSALPRRLSRRCSVAKRLERLKKNRRGGGLRQKMPHLSP